MKELSKKENLIAEGYFNSLKIAKPKIPGVFIFGLVGLVGSGKSTVAIEIAKEVGGTIVRSDDIRTILREKKLPFDALTTIKFKACEYVLSRGGIPIIDSDTVNAETRELIKQLGNRKQARTLYIRVVADPDVAFGRIITSKKEDPFFTGATSSWKGKGKAAAVKIRELWRRTPFHYSWNQEEGTWIVKTLPFPVVLTLDTTEESKWQKELKAFILRLRQV